MSYRELFSSINCQRVVLFEDDFSQMDYKKEKAFYDITRMDLADRELYLTEIDKLSADLANRIRNFLETFDQCFDSITSWNDHVIFGDITSAFSIIENIYPELKDKIVQLYSEIDEEWILSAYYAGEKYGIGVTHPSQFDSLFNDYIIFENRTKPIRVYTTYSAETRCQFQSDIDIATNQQSVVCIIDNQLSGTNRAKEIIESVEKANTAGRKNIVGSVFSSRESFEVISDTVYFEFTPKENAESLETAIAKSAYNYFIYELKVNTLGKLESAFDAALKNKGIAFYLARKAQIEGESEYHIINDWIKLLSTASQSDSEVIKHLIALSRVINSLEDSSESQDTFLQDLNTLEAFDYSINKFYLPVAAGDVFTDGAGNWYVLIGQDCDMARRPNKSPRNALSELLPAKTLMQTSFNKWASNLKTAEIFNFRKDLSKESEILQIDYQHRVYIANEIINLCAFNQDGQCRISLLSDPDSTQQRLMPKYMIEYYRKLQAFFNSIKTLRNKAKEAFNFINENEFAPRLISLSDFEIDSDTPTFKFRRVCRLTHTYVFYLYKLYLEYRGRQPFQTINLVRREDITFPVKFNQTTLEGVYAHIQCIPNPDKRNRGKWCWIIEKRELYRIAKALGIGLPLVSTDELIIETETEELQLSDNKRLQIKKAEKYISLSVI